MPLGRKACEYLKEYILKVRPKYLQDNLDERLLFVGILRKAITDQSLNIMVRKHAQKAGIAHPVSIHTIRRTFATHMLRNEAHPMYIQKILGHTYTRTLNRYVRVSGVDLKKTHQRTHPRETKA